MGFFKSSKYFQIMLYKAQNTTYLQQKACYNVIINICSSLDGELLLRTYFLSSAYSIHSV